MLVRVTVSVFSRHGFGVFCAMLAVMMVDLMLSGNASPATNTGFAIESAESTAVLISILAVLEAMLRTPARP